ncbi:MAG: hypothetical protein ACI9W2_002219 [Gammaproteobacteria bacterium]|jgi:hypothetical protein
MRNLGVRRNRLSVIGKLSTSVRVPLIRAYGAEIRFLVYFGAADAGTIVTRGASNGVYGS